MKQHIVYPVEIENVKRCLSSWRRYTKCKLHKQANVDHI